MVKTKSRVSLLTSAATKTSARPPKGLGVRQPSGAFDDLRLPKRQRAAAVQDVDGRDFTIWQLVDSAFPTGGFAHSSGLEAAWQHGEVRNRDEFVSFLKACLHQLGQAALPFVTAAHAEPGRLAELDQLCDAFTSNHIANRASRAQGRALLSAVERVFKSEDRNPKTEIQFAHLAPVFGACLREAGISDRTTGRMFFFNHLRSVLAAAVRLNIVGPMEAQILQQRLASTAENILNRCKSLTLDDLAQTSPLLDLWQSSHDRLYSRLFQS